ncbi:MAG: ribonuclease P protein component [Syntrophomonadaceae bacterium]|nr:ribonuclease P protein component [Syntrophomonadaceae bacterium]
MLFQTIQKKKDFNFVYKKGRKQVGKLMVIYAVKNGLDNNRYGIIASKKVGNAVIRNRAKRRLRAFICRNEGVIKNGFDVIIIARANIITGPFKEIENEGLGLMKRVGL